MDRDRSDAHIDDQRARARKLAAAGKRLGYGLFAVAVVAFLVGFATTLTDAVANLIIACLVVGSVVLAPAIVVAYGVKAADREDRERRA